MKSYQWLSLDNEFSSLVFQDIAFPTVTFYLSQVAKVEIRKILFIIFLLLYLQYIFPVLTVLWDRLIYLFIGQDFSQRLVLLIIALLEYFFSRTVLIIWFGWYLFGHLFLLSSSLSYEEGHPSLSDTNLLQRQTFAASHQLPGYSTTPQPTGKNSHVKYNMNLGTFSEQEENSIFTCWGMNVCQDETVPGKL